jgi:mono/diheme cytochrome c family protein
MHHHAPLFAVVLIASLARTVPASAADLAKLPEPAARADVTYAADIKPLFERSCVKCHGEEKQRAGLRLDSLKAALKGTKEEKVIVPGKSAESELVLSVAHATEDEEHWMPPEGKAEPLSKAEISLLRAWIDQGAK